MIPFKRCIFAIILCAVASFGKDILDVANKYYSEGDYANAILTYRKAIQAGENPALGYFNLANAYYQIDSLVKAIVCYEQAIKAAPNFAKGYHNLGILYFDLGKTVDAVLTLEKALLLEPDNIQIKLILAVCYKNLREYTKAILFLQEIAEKNPQQDDSYFLLYDIYMTLGDLQEARKWVERYPDDGKRVSDKYQLLADLSMQSERTSDALYYYNRIIALSPQKRWPYHQIVKILADNGTILAALQKAEDAMILFPDFKELALLSGSIAFENQYYQKAEQFFGQAYKLGHANGLVGLQNLVKVYQNNGMTDNVQRIHQLIIATK